MTNDYITKTVFKKYLSISITSMAAATVGMMIDGIVIGNFLGAKSMAAFGIVSPLFIIFSAVAGIFSNGSISLCGQYIGRDQADKVNVVFTIAIFSSGAAALLCALLCMAIPAQISGVLGAEGDTLLLAGSYVRGLGIGAIPIVLSQVLMAFTKTDGSPKLGLLSIVVMTAINVALDLANAFVLHMGMFGMAMATSLSYVAAMAVCCTHFFKPVNTLRFVRLTQPLKELGKICKTGMPNAINKICITLRTAMLNNLLAVLAGSVAITAFSIQNSLNTILGAVCTGVGSTTLLISGIFYGEEDRRTLRESVSVSLKIGVALTGIVCIISLLFIRPLVMMFGRENPAAADMAVRVVFWFLLSLPLYTINVVFLNYYQSVGNLFMANFMCIGDNFLFMVLFAVGLSGFMGVDGVWISFLAGELAMLAALAAVTAWKTKRFPRHLEDYLLLPEDFGVPADMQLNLSLENNWEQVTRLSENIGRFCKKRGIDSRRALRLSLCIEEMAGNTVQYAFQDQKKHFMDIRILIKDGLLIFRMRDDGTPFNPLKQLETASDDPYSNIGIRLVKNLSKSTEYRNTVGLNNLIVKL